jgi:hypothetical protein
MSYSDPKNTIEIIEKIKLCPTIGDVYKLSNKVFPNWIITCMSSYSNDYPVLTEHWTKSCTDKKIKKAQVLIVEELCHDKNHTLVHAFAEVFSMAGFSVRRKCEFFPCNVCQCALPSETLYNIFKKNGDQIPTVWDKKCSTC